MYTHRLERYCVPHYARSAYLESPLRQPDCSGYSVKQSQGEHRAKSPGRQQLILWWHFCGNINPLVSAAHDLADQLLTVPFSVGQGSIDKVQTQIDSPMKGYQ